MSTKDHYLITGGCGFIGSHLAKRLVALGHKVKILDNLSTGRRENAPKEATLIVDDICDKDAVKEALHGCVGVFHLAAVASMAASIEKWSETTRTNLYGTVCLLDAVLALPKKIPFIFTSTAAVYGNPEQFPLKEEARKIPLSPYGLDKLNCEHHLALASRLFDLPTFTFRLFNVYGPGQRADSPYSGVISIFAKKFRDKEKLTIFGSGRQQRDFIFVGDVTAFLAAAVQKPFKGAHVFNLCRGIGITVEELASHFETLFDAKIEKTYAKQRAGDIEISIGDPTAAENFFGIQAKTTLQEGLKHIYDA
jgi:UDP-glucose 4-epimerase